jgi:integrase
MKRARYQFGCLQRKSRRRGSDVWVLRHRQAQAKGGKKLQSIMIGTVEKYPTEAEAWRAAETLRLALNPENPNHGVVTFGTLIDRYLAEELPDRYSTRVSYGSYLRNHIRRKWAEYPISRVKPLAVEEWLKQLKLAPKTRAHIKNLMRILFNCAMRWELIEIRENPMRLVRVKDGSKREKEPRVLTMQEFHRLLNELPDEPYRTMVVTAMCLGLRVSELVGLQWGDFDWDGSKVSVQRAVVAGRVDRVKTKYSRKRIPLDPVLAGLLLNWKNRSQFNRDSDWVFASPHQAGKLPYRPWGIQQRHLQPAGARAQLGPGIGWHTFRHSYSTLLRHLKVDVKVQQELLRHADIRTTLNVYTQGVSDDLREANSKVVRMIFPGNPVGGGLEKTHS